MAALAGDDWLRDFVDHMVVIDIGEYYLAIGRLAAFSEQHLSLVDADLHDQREGNSTKDVYVLESRKFGVRVNRKRVDLPRRVKT